MSEISKHVDGAFVLSDHKASEFLTRKVYTSSDAIRRFEARNTKVEKVASNNDKWSIYMVNELSINMMRKSLKFKKSKGYSGY